MQGFEGHSGCFYVRQGVRGLFPFPVVFAIPCVRRVLSAFVSSEGIDLRIAHKTKSNPIRPTSTPLRLTYCCGCFLLTRLNSLASQMMGVLAKRVFPRAWDHPPPATAAAAAATVAAAEHTAGEGTSPPPPPTTRRGVYHVSIAQCYDKKLEASRKDFRHEDLGDDPEVDLVLTTAEVLELIQDAAVLANHGNAGANANPALDATLGASADPPLIPADSAGNFFRRHSPPGELAEPLAPGFPVAQAAASADGLALFGGVDGEGAAGGGSGGYLEYVFRHAAREIFGVDLAGRPLVYVEGRNSDFRETSLEVKNRFRRCACACAFVGG